MAVRQLTISWNRNKKAEKTGCGKVFLDCWWERQKHMGLSTASVIILHYDRLRYHLYPDPWSWGPTEDFISELEHCTSSLSPTACINVLPTVFSLDCAAMQGFFIRQNGEWRLSGALAFRVCLCDIDYICVSYESVQFDCLVQNLISEYNFHFWFNYFFFTKHSLILCKHYPQGSSTGGPR